LCDNTVWVVVLIMLILKEKLEKKLFPITGIQDCLLVDTNLVFEFTFWYFYFLIYKRLINLSSVLETNKCFRALQFFFETFFICFTSLQMFLNLLQNIFKVSNHLSITIFKGCKNRDNWFFIRSKNTKRLVLSKLRTKSWKMEKIPSTWLFSKKHNKKM
jgi:hypothetical protein